MLQSLYAIEEIRTCWNNGLWKEPQEVLKYRHAEKDSEEALQKKSLCNTHNRPSRPNDDDHVPGVGHLRVERKQLFHCTSKHSGIFLHGLSFSTA
jgi:hypothetical protein